MVVSRCILRLNQLLLRVLGLDGRDDLRNPCKAFHAIELLLAVEEHREQRERSPRSPSIPRGLSCVVSCLFSSVAPSFYEPWSIPRRSHSSNFNGLQYNLSVTAPRGDTSKLQYNNSCLSDLPPDVSPPRQFGHADNLTGVTVRVSWVVGRHPAHDAGGAYCSDRARSTRTWASCSVEKSSPFSNSSRNFSLKDSTYPFSHGLPGSMNKGSTVSRPYQARRAVADDDC